MAMLESYKVLLVLISIMITMGIFKDQNITKRIAGSVLSKIKNKGLFVCAVSLVSGVLPIHNRIIATSAILDGLQDKTKDNKALGVVSYLATHHYYLWSPIEKSVIISMGILGISYLAFLKLMAIPIIACFLISGVMIYLIIKKDGITLYEKSEEKPSRGDVFDTLMLLASIVACIALPTWIPFSAMTVYMIARHRPNLKALGGYLDPKLIVIVAGVLSFGMIAQSYTGVMVEYLKGMGSVPVIVAMGVAFMSAFVLGSSSRYATLAAILTTLFGPHMFPLFYISEYAAYLISPTHKCVLIGSTYFKTPLSYYYKKLGLFAALMLIVAGITVLL